MRKLQLFVILLVFVSHLGIQAQSKGGDRGVVFEEDFNGWTAITDEGWFTYTDVGWNMVSATDDAINFYKQDPGSWVMLISPEMDLTDATLLTFLHKTGSSLTGQKFEVGTMTNPTDPGTFELLNIVNVTSTEWTSEGSETILTDVTGLKHIAFNIAASSPTGSYMWIDDVLITDDVTQANWPAFITDLDITAGDMGVNNATVSWTNPSTEADGDPLTDLDSVVVLRDGQWAHTVFSPIIGSYEAVQIDVPEAGLYVFTVTAYNSEGGSVPMYNDPAAWVGLDTPGPAENLVLTVTNDSVAELTWTTPTTGGHGGYFDGVVDTYRIIRADGSENTIMGNIVTYSEVVDIAGTYNFTVTGINSSGEGAPSVSTTAAFYIDGFLLAEDFWVSVPALDWVKQGFGAWYHWFTNYTGSPNYGEMILYPSHSFPFTGIARMVSPVLNSQDIAALTIKFRHYQDWNSGSYDFKIQTTSDGGTTWTDAWTIAVNGGIMGESKLVVIDNDDVGSENFQFSFVFEGNSEHLEFLSIDDIWLFESAEIELVATDLILPGLIEPNDVLQPQGTLENWGYLETNFTAVMAFFDENNDLVYSSLIDSVIPGGGFIELTFEDWVAEEGSFLANFTIASSGDTTVDNNTLTQEFDVFHLSSERTLVVCEEGTGTWCGYCPSAARGLDELVENNWPVAVVAYHRSDNYETEEGVERINYYEISGYPTVIFDGTDYFVGSDGSDNMYDAYLPIVQQHLNIPAAASISFTSMSITENTMNVVVFVESGSPIISDNIVLQAILTESHIPESWQGLDEVNFVERTMYQGSQGTPIDLSNQTAWVTVSIDLDPAWVKSNSELVVFVQNLDNQQIYNGNKVDLITVSIKEKEKWVGVYPNPASSFITISNCDDAEINMYTIQGQKVLTENISGQTAKIDVSGLNFGMHILEIVIDGKRFTEKILINN